MKNHGRHQSFSSVKTTEYAYGARFHRWKPAIPEDCESWAPSARGRVDWLSGEEIPQRKQGQNLPFSY